MRGRIVFPQIGLNFDNPGREKPALSLPHQHLSEQFAGDSPRTTGKKGT